MSTIEETIEVGVPVRAAYDQWTQFEEFPRFMEAVDEVRQLDDTHLHWRASIAGDTREWDAEITEQVPERVIAWRATGGYQNAGAVHFEPIAADRTRIHLQLDHEPEGAKEKIGDWLGMASRQAKNDLERFRELIETRGAPTGGWRGEVHGGTTTGGGGMEPGTDTGGFGGAGAGGMGAATISEGTFGESEETFGESGSMRDERRTDREGFAGSDPGRDVTEGPTPETRGAIREDEEPTDPGRRAI